MLRDDEPLTPIEELALREVLRGLREVEAASGYGSVTLFVKESGERMRVCTTHERQIAG